MENNASKVEKKQLFILFAYILILYFIVRGLYTHKWSACLSVKIN